MILANLVFDGRGRSFKANHVCTHHGGQADVGQAADQGLTEAGQLQEQGIVPLLDLFVLLLHALQVLLH